MRQVLAEGYHVVSIDARGHGDSDWAPTGKCDIESFAADLLVVDPLLDAATRVRIPTLPVRGLMSGIVSDAGVAELRDHLPALEVCDVAKAGHMLTGDRNDAFNHAVLGFLRRHAPL
jgi:pimeloyl-ACP methyl ester carboxylesterase